MSSPFVVSTHADLDRLIAVSQHAPHRALLYHSVRQGIITLCEIPRDGLLPVADLKRSPRPKLVLIGDDDGLDTGPNGWAARPRLTGWARHAMIHATGGDVATYSAAVALTIERQQVVLVETGSVHCMAWHGLFARAGVRTLNFVPPSDSVHPVPIRKGDLH